MTQLLKISVYKQTHLLSHTDKELLIKNKYKVVIITWNVNHMWSKHATWKSSFPLSPSYVDYHSYSSVMIKYVTIILHRSPADNIPSGKFKTTMQIWYKEIWPAVQAGVFSLVT